MRVAFSVSGELVWEATSLRADFRAQVAEVGFAYGALVTFVLFPRSAASVRARNRARTHAVPEAALAKQLAGWEWPERHESHRLLVIGERGEVLAFEGSAGDELPFGLGGATGTA